MNRRRLLQLSAMAGSAFLLEGIGLVGCGRAANCRIVRPPGAQLWTIRELLQADPRAALMSLGNIGIREIELYGLNGSSDAEAQLFGLSPTEFLDALRAANLTMAMAHIAGNWTNTGVIAEIANALGVEALALALPEIFTDSSSGTFNMVRAKSLAEVDGLIGRLNQVADEFRSLGLTFAYHNHHVEFIPIDGEVPYHYIMERTDPDLVKIELDIGWVGAAGLDPAQQVKRYADRLISCHLKDFDSRIRLLENPDLDSILAAIVEPGAGTIDFPRVLEAIDAAAVPHAFVEIDVVADPLDAIDRSNRYLQSLASC